MRNKITFYINDQEKVVGAEQASMMLSDYLRYEQGLTGTKVVCAEGDCGACTVLKYNPLTKGTDADNFLPVNSCIMPLSSLDGSHILTIESLQKGDQLHEAQRAMMECHGSQCGFCTPGFVMALAGLCEERLTQKKECLSEQEVKNVTTGNLCRCTGYAPIIEAGKNIDLGKIEALKKRYLTAERLQKLKEVIKEPVLLESEDYTFFAPKTVNEASEFLKKHKKVRILASGTDLGVVHNKRKTQLSALMSLHLMDELYQMSKKGNRLEVGARVTINELRHLVKNDIPEFARFLDIFASPQIKNNATLVGNIANASPIGDTPPIMLALDARIHLNDGQNERVVPIETFFQGYRQIDLKEGELITKVDFLIPETTEYFKAYKTSIRKDLDISTVNLAVRAKLDGEKVVEVKIAAGGIAATPLRLLQTEKFLAGKKLERTQIQAAIDIAQQEFQPLSDVRASSAYRRVLVSNYLSRCFQEMINGKEEVLA